MAKKKKNKKSSRKAGQKPGLKSVLKRARPKIGIVMGSDSDLGVMQAASDVLNEFGISHEVRIISAHRTPEAMLEYASEAHLRGLKVLIAGAGGAAHLPGMIASATVLPVIGVPVNITKLEGIDALLSIMQMPKGVPVATVAIDNAANAALLALRILAIEDVSLVRALNTYKKNQVRKVIKADRLVSNR